MRARASAVIFAISVSGPALAADPTDLSPVTVTATRTEHSVREAPASVSVITAEEIRAKGATNVLEAIRTLPGITMAGRQVGGRKTVNIRGAEDRHTLVLVNGRRISSTDDVIGHSDYQYSWVPLNQIERIEVVRGPMSALYGSEAVGGVINIITKDAGDAWHGIATGRGDVGLDSGGDGHHFSAGASGPIGAGFSLGFTAEHFRRTDVPLAENPRVTEIEGQDRKSGSVDLTYEPVEGHELFANVIVGDEERGRDSADRTGLLFYRDTYDIERRQYSAGYRGEWGIFRPEVSYTRATFDVTNSRTMGVAPTRPQSLQDDIVDGRVLFPIGDSHVVTAGGELREETLWNNGLLPTGEDSAKHRAAYLQDEYAITDALALTLGVRNDHHEIFGNELSPRAYLVWKAMPSLVVKGGYGQAFRAPTLKQISPSYVGAEGPHTFSGNANIKPETSESYELGVDWRQGGTGATATVFRNDIEDLIYTRLIGSMGPRNFYIYDNISSARLQGVEASISQALPYGFTVSANYMYLDATNKSTGGPLDGRPEHSASGTLAWAEREWGAAFTTEYIGEQYLQGAAGLAEAPGYTLLSLTGSYQLHENLALRGGVRNLTDVRLADESPLFGYSEMGRLVFFGVEATF